MPYWKTLWNSIFLEYLNIDYVFELKHNQCLNILNCNYKLKYVVELWMVVFMPQYCRESLVADNNGAQHPIE